MSVRNSILVILELGPCYGNQLRFEMQKRTGAIINVGQIYSTLERLERDGFVSRLAPLDGQIPYAITPEGSAEARAWLGSAVDRVLGERDEYVMKISLAMTVPGADAASLIAAQRLSAIAAAASELQWLDEAERRLGAARAFGLDSETPRRGRPTGIATRA